MKQLAIGFVVALALAGSAMAQAPRAPLAIPGEGVATDLPGASQLPDPARTYKVVFDVAGGAKGVDDVNPGLKGAARFVNTLAAHGVDAQHRRIAVVIHQDATDLILNDAAFQARNPGHPNPNLALVRAMTAAGVKFYVCGQAVLARKIDPKTITPEVELTLWALTTLVNLQLDGYVKVGGG